MPTEHAAPRIAVVTGGGGALGSAIGRRLAADGDLVVLADIDLDAAERVAGDAAARGPGEARLVARRADLGDPGSIQKLVDGLGAEFGRIDIVVNNAAVQRRNGLADLSADDWNVAVDVNLRGPALLCHSILPYWRRQRSGAVVNIASRVWLSGGPPIYVAAKTGLIGLTRSLATELGPIGVTANAVAPGFLPTQFTRADREDTALQALAERHRQLSPLKRLAEPSDIAHAVAFLASPNARFITGEVLHVCGGAQMAPLA